ncbi:MAG: hypothetical protein SFV15_01265 [Polyangiaceae bacterium]|nr:hypothetical protein [Polyangiaceae bacterium]
MGSLLAVSACGNAPKASYGPGDASTLLSVDLKEAGRGLRAPLSEPSGDCRDVGLVRVCWGGACKDATCVGARRVPEVAGAPAMRCLGSGENRRCFPRFEGVGRFVCSGSECVQAHPRYPDVNEWSCADRGGAVVCRKEGEAAVSSGSAPDAGWVCGARARSGERLCVNFDPDYPDASGALAWSCRYEAQPQARRVCQRAHFGTALGAQCGANLAPCDPGAACEAGVCVPRPPAVGCWLDADCDAGQTCGLGTCMDRNAAQLKPKSASFGLPKVDSAAPGAWGVVSVKDMPLPEQLEVRPAGSVTGYQVFGGAWRLRLLPGVAKIKVRAAGACELELNTSEQKGAHVVAFAELRPLFRLTTPRTEVGFGQSFHVQAQANCRLPAGARFRFTETTPLQPGAPVREAWGAEYSGRMPSVSEALGNSIPWGIVPVSARAASKTELVAQVLDATGKVLATQTQTLFAAARASGLPNVAVDHSLYLGGKGWRATLRPPQSRATLNQEASLASFLLDVPGTFEFTDNEQRSVRVHAGRLDAMPLDCGRSGCHTETVRLGVGTPMARALQAVSEGQHACALGCHTLGEPGLEDGGYVHISREIGPNFNSATPRELERLAHVGCLGCHGPGAIPEPEGRWAILRSDVCAVCHDAPPAYGHHQAFLQSRMARAPSTPKMSQAACARCHTTSGFLQELLPGAPNRTQPAHVNQGGLTCVTCHAVHGEGSLPHLVRDIGVQARGFNPTQLGTSAVCVGCHSAGQGTALPFASSASIWAGKGGMEPLTGEPLVGAAPHANLGQGCLACHRGAGGDLHTGYGHSFSASRSQCTLCHGDVPDSSGLRKRAEAAWAALGFPAWAGHSEAPARFSPTSARDRARYNLTLLFEDPAFDAHNPSYAEQLLSSVERFITHTPTPIESPKR